MSEGLDTILGNVNKKAVLFKAPLDEFEAVLHPPERHIETSAFECHICGDVVEAWGDGWDYERMGSISKFTQTKKLPSRRTVRDLIKRLEFLGGASV